MIYIYTFYTAVILGDAASHLTAKVTTTTTEQCSFVANILGHNPSIHILQTRLGGTAILPPRPHPLLHPRPLGLLGGPGGPGGLHGLGVALGAPPQLRLPLLGVAREHVLLGRDGGALVDGDAGAGRDDVLDDVALVVRGAPARGDGDHVALADRVVGVVDEVVYGELETLFRGAWNGSEFVCINHVLVFFWGAVPQVSWTQK